MSSQTIESSTIHHRANSRRRNIIKNIALAPFIGYIGFESSASAAGGFPNRPITLIAPWTPGGATDAVLRQLAKSASPHLGQPVIVVNKPGGGGVIGPAGMAATAKPDGYTISQVATSLFRMAHLQDVTYDPIADFTYIIGLSAWTTGVVVRSDARWKTWKEFVSFARANPNALSYGSSGIGSTLHIFMEQISQAEGIKLLHVPYKGTADMSLALLSGDIMSMAVDLGGAAGLIDGGKARLLVTWGNERIKRWPDVPTLKETGLDIVAVAPFGLAGPKGMDPAVVKILFNAFDKARQDPQYIAICDQYVFEPAYKSSADLKRWAIDTYQEQGKALKALGLSKI